MGCYLVFVYSDNETSTWCVGFKGVKLFLQDEKEAALKYAQRHSHTHPALIKQRNLERYVGIKGDDLDAPLFHWTKYDEMPTPEPELDEKTEDEWIARSDKIVEELGLTQKYGLNQGGYRIGVSFIPYAGDDDCALKQDSSSPKKRARGD